MSARYEKLKTLLKELFQLDQPDLDFGLYRIMHAKSGEVTAFLDADLLPQVKEAFALYQPADKAALQAELDQIVGSVQAAGMNPDDSPKVRELREKIASSAVDIAALEAEVYDHLYSFFRRYYSEGDFLSKRVYKEGVYAIPYEGEEVTLHWANKDQYYIKTSEYLRDYCIRLRPDDAAHPMRVHFRLTDAAEGEHGNVKAADGKDRVFVLAAAGDSGHEFLTIDDGPQGPELSIRFEYRPATLTDWPAEVREGKTKPPAQKDLAAVAVGRVLAVSAEPFGPWIAELRKPHVTASGEAADYSRLEGHLKRYTARNTFDYFIHKDLGTFLRRELDFYIKNEVMHLDDIENEKVPRVEQYLSKIKVIRRIAGKIIDFLAQLEDFQKKLWLKKKFVVETQWCVRVGCIPEEFYDEIAANDAQRDEWVSLLAIDEIEGDLTTLGYSTPLKPEFLKAHSTLVVDTRHFDADFTARLLEAMGDIDEETDGVLFHSENFQALSLMRSRYEEDIQCIYIDPPYNTDAGPIDYKNGYRDSSWMTLMCDRLQQAFGFLEEDGVLCVTIDDYQVHELGDLLNRVFGKERQLGTAVIRNNPSGRSTVEGLSICHEYAFFYQRDHGSLKRFPRTEEQLDRFTEEGGEYVDWRNFRKDGGEVTHRAQRPKQFYPLYITEASGKIRIPRMTWNEANRSWNIDEEALPSEVVLFPVDERGSDRVWSLNHISALENMNALEVRRNREGKVQVYRRHRPSDGILPRSWWDRNVYAAREHGTAALNALFAKSPFSFAKSPHAVQDSIWVSGLNANAHGRVLDFFGGSGTTAHAVINLNRTDEGWRRFLLVEMGAYFDFVLVPRVKKLVFTPEWKDGKPKRLATPQEAERSPRIMKIVRLESYEDTLNNLDIRRSDAQKSLLDEPAAKGDGKLREQYLLKYMLDVETRGSHSLLNVAAFRDPTAYRLSVKRPGSDESREVCVDLLETFNWLIGLTVEAIAAPQVFSAAFERDAEQRLQLKGGRIKADPKGPFWFRRVEGKLADGRKALIVWRKLGDDLEQANLVLDHFLTEKLKISTKDFEFDVIYVNGSNNLENLKAPDDTWKVRLLEEEFHRLMFATEDV
jgi:adenine-specific DNA-methyltransferase